MTDLKELKKMRLTAREAATRVSADTSLRALMATDRKGGDHGYNGTTFLYIRAIEGDTGGRPFPPNTVFWLSPDVELFDAAGVRVTTTDISAGSSYVVEVVVTNDGDLDANACQVELFVDDPSIGFGTEASRLMGMQMISVGAMARASARFTFTASADMTGHRCLFARVASVMTNDFPADWTGFNAWADRHLGQQNLNIVQQQSVFEFNINLRETHQHSDLSLAVRPNARALDGGRLPLLGRYLLVDRAPTGIAITRTTAPKIAPAAAPIATLPRRPGLRSVNRGTTPVVVAHTTATAFAPLGGRDKHCWTFRSALARERFRIDVPDFGLHANEALPLEVRLTDPATGEIVGGITLLVVG